MPPATTPAPTILDVALLLARSPFGLLIYAGLAIVMAVLALPFFFAYPGEWRKVEIRVELSRLGYALGFFCMGAGCLYFEMQAMPHAWRLSGPSQFGLSALFFAIAARSGYSAFR